MAAILDFIDTHLQRGTITSIVIVATATLVMMVYAIAEREYMSIALVFVIIGLSGTWREYVVWQRRRRQDGLELIGTSKELEA